MMYFYKVNNKKYLSDLCIELKVINKISKYDTRNKAPYLPKIRTNYGKRAASYYSKFFNVYKDLVERNKTMTKFKMELIEQLPQIQ